MAAHGEPLTPKKRLDSWKEIAAFFGRDERIYRVPGSARGGVFAYAEELAEWLKTPSHVLDSGEVKPAKLSTYDSQGKIPPAVEHNINEHGLAATVEATTRPSSRESVIPIRAAMADTGRSAALDTARGLAPAASRLGAAKPFLWIVPLALMVGTFLIFSVGHRETRFKNALAAPHVPSAEAQDLYLKGRYYFEKRTPDDLNKAVDFFTQAIVHDPGYPAPYVGLADTYNLLREYSAMPPQEALPRARAAASKAVELDPNSAEGHNSLAFATFWGFFDAATADREFRRAIQLDPLLPRAHHWYATFLIEAGRNKEALAEIERARQLDPSSTPILADKGFILAEAGKREEARALLTQLAISQPEFAHAHDYLARVVYFPEGEYTGYFQEARIAARLQHEVGLEKLLDAEEKGYNREGLQGLLEARRSIAEDSFKRGLGSAFAVADTNAALGQNDEAMKYLRISVQRHELDLCTVVVSTSFKGLHQDQEFRDLVAKLGLPPLP
jgi:tetratricopeptide (TPR) repeat protein